MGKRATGEISLRQRSNGIWEARVRLDGKQLSFSGETKATARRRAEDAYRNWEQGRPVVRNRVRVEGWFTSWLANVVKPGLAPRTYESYRQHVRDHIVPRLGKKALVELAPADVRTFLNDLSEAGLAPTTVQRVRATLRAGLSQAVEDKLVSWNVAAGRKMGPRVETQKVPALDPEDAHAILEAIRGDRLEHLYVTALYTGLRQGEVLGLRWQDIDWQHERTTLAGAVKRIQGRLLWVPEAKNPDSLRTVHLTQRVVDELKAQRRLQAQERLAAGADWMDTGGLVFTRPDGRCLDPSQVTHQLQLLIKSAGLRHLRFHDLRHGNASLLFEAGATMKDVSEHLGHRNITTTANLYTHLSERRKKRTAQAIERVLGPKGASEREAQ